MRPLTYGNAMSLGWTMLFAC